MRKCSVCINGIEAGILTENDSPREYIFKYHKGYLENNLKTRKSFYASSRKRIQVTGIVPLFFQSSFRGRESCHTIIVTPH